MPTFNVIPANTRTPGFMAEVDGSQAGGQTQVLRTLIMGMKSTGASGAADVLTKMLSASQARAEFGDDSMVAQMVEKLLVADPTADLYVIAQDEPAAGVAATGSITVTGPASGDGTIYLYIGGQKVEVAVSNGDTDSVIAAAIAAAITAISTLPVTASAALAVVTLDAIHKGEYGNTIDVRANYLGSAGGEVLPSNVGLTIVEPAGGTSAPALATSIAAISDDDFEVIAFPYTDATSLAAIKADMADDAAGRWGPLRQLYGHVVACHQDTVVNLVTKGNANNDPHITIFGATNHLALVHEIAATAAGRIMASVRNHPARPFQTLTMPGILAPASADRHTKTERQTLLLNGIATMLVDASATVRIERAITTYQLDAFSNPDTAFLDSQTLFTNGYLLRAIRGMTEGKYGRHILVNDGTRVDPNVAAVSPGVIAGELVALYRQWERQAIVENEEDFVANLEVVRSGTDPNRLDITFPPDLANQLRITALSLRFRLNYPTT